MRYNIRYRSGMENKISGLHHVTAIAGPAQENLDFYAGVLGMRLVKKSVNQDDTGTYHLFYADAEGHPGTDITFFPWADLAPRRAGYGLSTEVSLAVPPGSLTFWAERLGLDASAIETRLQREGPARGRSTWLASCARRKREFARSAFCAVGPESDPGGTPDPRIGKRAAARARSRRTGCVSARRPRVSRNRGRERVATFGVGEGTSGQYLDLQAAAPNERRGAWGTGTVHHLAWRVGDDAEELAVREKVLRAGAQPTPVIDRFWFKSVYFREPGGVLFELATDGPGFAVDEEAATLGESLVLPPWLEANRSAIEAVLPPLVRAGREGLKDRSSRAQRSAVEGSRGIAVKLAREIFPETRRDPSTALRSARDDKTAS